MPALEKPVWREKTKDCLPFAKPFRKIWLNSKQGFWNVFRVFTPHPPTERDDIHVVLVWNFREQRNICRGTYQRAYHFYGTFGQNFPRNGSSIFFFEQKTGIRLTYTIYKISVNLSPSLETGTGSPHKWYRKFGCFSLRAPFLFCAHLFPSACYAGYGCFGKSRKKVSISRKVLPFSEKFPSDWTIVFEFFPELPGFPYSVEMISAPFRTESVPNRDVLDSNSICKNPPFTSYSGFCGHLSVKRIHTDLCKWWTQFRNEI